MENSIYLATETMSAVIILILIYANNFEIKVHSLKRRLFNVMLILEEIGVITDVITFLPFDWYKAPILINVLITCTYTIPSIMKIFFTAYLYIHISAKAYISKKPFNIMGGYSLVEFVIATLLCITGKMFYIQDGVFYSGSMEITYYISTIFSVIVFLVIIALNTKKIGLHSTIAVLPFCAIPVLSMVIIILTGLNLAITMMSFCMLLIYIMLQSEHESSLYTLANKDELTGLYNRTAYEEEIAELSLNDDSLVYVSIDLNGLKAANDSLGHSAGDELIQGAAHCLKKAFGGSGKVFRIGGDEFAAILFPDGNNFKFETIKGSLNIMTKNWKGKTVDSLTLSVGYATKKEFPDEDIIGLARIADKRMYAEKSKFYTQKGVDRRGQNNAYKALSSLYTKILKINITDDSYTIVDMFSDEQTQEKGFSERISAWLIGFGKSGLVHPEDLENYLSKTNLDFMREYFKSGKTLLMISYRRKYGDEFKQAIMEIIPTNEYSNEDQSLYLYVKSIE